MFKFVNKIKKYVPGAMFIPDIVETQVHETESLDEDMENHIAPAAGAEDFHGEVVIEEADHENLDQDKFATLLWRGKLKNNVRTVLPLNLAAMPDLAGAGGMSVIAEKFARNAHLTPLEDGSFGPAIGNYTVEQRFPTTIAGNMAHVCLPGDLVEEAVVFAFGLEDIVSIATSALQSVGGPVVTGAISAAKAVFGLLKGIGGSNPSDSSSSSAQAPSLSGTMDVSRFLNFLKPTYRNEIADPTFPNLLLHPRDFIDSLGADITDIPTRIWGIANQLGIDRQLWDRVFEPLTIPNRVAIPSDRWPYIIDRFGAHPNTLNVGTFQNTCFRKFVKCCLQRATDGAPLYLNDVLDTTLDERDDEVYTSIVNGDITCYQTVQD